MRRSQTAREIACDMKGYMGNVVTRFDNWTGTRTAKSPGIHQPPSPEGHSKPLSPADVNTLQQLVGSVLYYTRAIDPTYIYETNELSPKQPSATKSIILPTKINA